jgi:hypothetical protein
MKTNQLPWAPRRIVSLSAIHKETKRIVETDQEETDQDETEQGETNQDETDQGALDHGEMD